MIKNKNKLLPIFFLFLIAGCNNGPKTIEPFSLTKMNKEHTTNDVNSDIHEVTVGEILPTSKYVYLNVKEGDKEFWIAAPKQEVKEGNVYLYNEALLKTQFESKEYQRVFDTVYLVTALIPKDHGVKTTLINKPKTNSKKTNTVKKSIASSQDSKGQFVGSVKIAELIKDPEKFGGKIVELTGKCVKINPNIMGKNWIHLKDGSQDNFDLVITSEEIVQKDSRITLRGEVILNKDFGSGYSFDLILENGILIN